MNNEYFDLVVSGLTTGFAFLTVLAIMTLTFISACWILTKIFDFFKYKG